MVNNGVIQIDNKDRNRANNLLTCRTGFELVRVLVAATKLTIEADVHSSPHSAQENISGNENNDKHFEKLTVEKVKSQLEDSQPKVDAAVKNPQNFVNERDSDNNAILNSEKSDQDGSNGNESNSTQSDESNNMGNKANISNANAPVPGSSDRLPINIVEEFDVNHKKMLIIVRDAIKSEIDRINSATSELDTSEVRKRLTEGLKVIETLLERHEQVFCDDTLKKAHTVLNEFIANVRKLDTTDPNGARKYNVLAWERQQNIDMKAYINAFRTVLKDGTDFEKCLKSVYGIEWKMTHTIKLDKLSEDELDSIFSLLNVGLTLNQWDKINGIIDPTLTDDQKDRMYTILDKTILRGLSEQDKAAIWRTEDESLTDEERTQINRMVDAIYKPETHLKLWNIEKENLTKEDLKKIYEILRQTKLNDDQAKNAYKILVTERIRKLMEPLTKYKDYIRRLLNNPIVQRIFNKGQIPKWLSNEPPKTRSWLRRLFRSLPKCVAGSNQ